MAQFISSCARLPKQGLQILQGEDKAPTVLFLATLAKVVVIATLIREIGAWKSGSLNGLKALGWGAFYIDTAIAADNLYILYCSGIPKEFLLIAEESKLASLIDGRLKLDAEGIQALGQGTLHTATNAAKRGFNGIKAIFSPPTEEEQAQQAMESLQRNATFILRNTLTKKVYTLSRKVF